jgi:hypothetical protein
VALFLPALLASSAQATVTQTLGFGSAVKSFDRYASFDSLTYNSPLRGYTENGLIIDRPGYCYGCIGYHYVAGTEPTTISAADGQELAALELEVDLASEIPLRTILYWEAHDDGATVGSGIVIAPRHSFVGFFDPAGFDDLQILAYYRLTEAQAIAAVGFARATPIFSAVEIDNVFAEVAVDSDADGRVGRFDNCQDAPNPEQADSDHDGQGDACDEFPQGGSALVQCLDDFNALLGDPRLTDTDDDGEADASDHCPGTAAVSEVDDAGCSVQQFCGGIDPGSSQGRRNCAHAIWRPDDPLQRWKGDCKVVRAACIPR